MKKKLNKKNIILSLLSLLLLAAFIFSIIGILRWKIDSNKTKKQIDNIEDKINIKEIKDNDNTKIINQDTDIPKSNPYWDYIKLNLINVDFSELQSINNQVKGWIQVNGTTINYPFVQTDNNDFYLTHSFDKSHNNAGWIFLDYRNNLNLNNRNIILYGHGRLDVTMFGSLKNILTSGWTNNKDNYVIKLSTEKENTLWQVFSIYHIPTTSDYIKTDFYSDDEFLQFANTLLNRSSFNFNTTVNKNDNIITLSTCYNENEKVVLHAKLIKKEIR